MSKINENSTLNVKFVVDVYKRQGYMNQPVSLVILDINLPDGDGRMFLKHIRQSNTVPVLLLTARDTEMCIRDRA